MTLPCPPFAAPRLLQLAFVVVMFAGSAPAQTVSAEPDIRPELELKRHLVATSTDELSGFTIKGGTGTGADALYAVADKDKDHYIYRLKLSDGGKRYKLEPAIDLSRLQGFAAYTDGLKTETRVPEKDRRLDLEGIAVCGDTFYLINERVRQLLVVDSKSLQRAPIDFSSYADLFAGESNAGFEGVTADCDKGLLYIAKEREPRRLLTVELKSWTLLGDHDVPASDRTGRKVINPFTGGGLMPLSDDFAALTFDGGYLYALERNSFEIAKIDPVKYTVVARVSYFKSELGLYETDEPFGLAEALHLGKDEIFVGLDHNGTPLSGKAAKRTGVKGNFGSILVFKRPAGF